MPIYEGRMKFSADSDAQIVKGLIALLLAFITMLPDKFIFSPAFLKKKGLDNNYRRTQNGVNALLKQYNCCFSNNKLGSFTKLIKECVKKT
jgi:sulfur transfer protein SufE